ncbi:phosphopantetheine-binding protein [Streptomyces sp. 71268]|uniref:ACP S-malonyltransferase n=1 Tax=Streptomyces sp. 71268 TaxID=3002640 RepID=UPI0023F9B48F|nr:phosphopantetheine-binding protein [Streptomyces sp. 71268]WEV29335.1 phosphopantetheine-binding protein [Streptomyces sp. 71268]
MAAETVFLLPGQGGYVPGMFAGETATEVAEVMHIADAVAGEFGRGGVSGLLTDPDAADAATLAKDDSFTLQLALYAAALASARRAAHRRNPDVLVGHSMGEIAALTYAGAFDIADGARLVCHRALALLAHCPQPGGMLALTLPAGRAEHLVRAVAAPGLAVAVTNAPRHTVVSGPEEALATVARVTSALEVGTVRLPAPFPFHGPLLGVAAEAFAAAVSDVRQRPLRALVYSPVAGGYVTDATDLKALLVRQLTAPVPFLAAVRELHATGAQHFVECGAAGLAGLVRRSVPDVSTESTTDTAAEPATDAGPTPATGAAAGQGSGGRDVLGELRELYAGTLGYPVEAVTGDADLEADLGIDSLKRAEMLGKVSAHFGLDASADGGRFLAQSTLAELAELVAAAAGRSADPGAASLAAVVPASVADPASAAAPTLTPGPAPVPTLARDAAPASGEVAGLGAGGRDVLGELRELYAGTLGYPVEAVTGDADLEADLGIDSLKRAEMLGKVSAHFGLDASADGGRFLAQSTLAELAELIAAARATGR